MNTRFRTASQKKTKQTKTKQKKELHLYQRTPKKPNRLVLPNNFSLHLSLLVGDTLEQSNVISF